MRLFNIIYFTSIIVFLNMLSCAGDETVRDYDLEGVDGSPTETGEHAGAGLPINITGASLAMSCEFVKNITDENIGKIGCVITDDNLEKVSLEPSESSARIKTTENKWFDAKITHLGKESDFTFILDDTDQIDNIFDSRFIHYTAKTEKHGDINLFVIVEIDRPEISTEPRTFYISSNADEKNSVCTKEYPCNKIDKAILVLAEHIQHTMIIKIANIGVYSGPIAFNNRNISNSGRLKIIGYDKDFKNEESITLQPIENQFAPMITFQGNSKSSTIQLHNMNIKTNTFGLIISSSSVELSNISIEGDNQGINIKDSKVHFVGDTIIKKLGSNQKDTGLYATGSEIFLNEGANIKVDNYRTNIWFQNSNLSDHVGRYSNKKISSKNSGGIGLGLSSANMNLSYTSVDLDDCEEICLSIIEGSSLNFEATFDDSLDEIPLSFKVNNKDLPAESTQNEKSKQILTFTKNSTSVIDLSVLNAQNISFCNKNSEVAPGFRLGFNATSILKFPKIDGSNTNLTGLLCEDIFNNTLDLSSRFFVNNKSCSLSNKSIQACVQN